MKLIKIVFLLTSVIIFSACSKGPSSSDIESVMSKNLENFNNLIPKALGQNMKFEIHEVKSYGCEEKPDGVYSCDVEIDMTAPVVGRKKDRSKVDFVEREGEWQTVRQFKP